MKNIKAHLVVAGCLLATCGSLSAAAVLPFTETFSSNNSNWTQNVSATAANWISSGGAGGSGGYITTTYSVTNTTSGTPVVARATGSNSASGGQFIGDYSEIDTITVSVKSNATFDLPIALRLGGAVPGTAITINGGILPAGADWTTFTFNLTANNFISYEGTPGADNAAKFANATSNVANLQLFFYLGAAGYTPPSTTTPVTLSVDSVSLVPEPSACVLSALGVVGLFCFRSRKQA
ncbi:hypothetical protein JIN84_12095 [Luteolibacter yonseiensis]|uniref:Ice-binding protein C-terminal domain-containing protein n=1 Tax=Luteolibacter yonseiensis TaxID=1144680 RepID=A0A934R5I7_9BACT|nr:hypothetical protein [Luteolibacter yonseiensis]MBK1816358.1 hypothetical protein [Luteolibacter yonseiensis]